MKNILKVWAFSFLVLFSCARSTATFATEGPAPDHKIWDELLKKYVSDNGFMDYKGIISEKAKFEKYLDQLSANAPSDSWTKNEKLAYWINVYNAFTVKLIIEQLSFKEHQGLEPHVEHPYNKHSVDQRFL